MRFDKAYCVELKKAITPYLARELYFNEDGEYYRQKLSFRCEHEKCRVELVGVNLYNEKKPKRALHFRTKQHIEHNPDCDYYFDKHAVRVTETDDVKDEDGFKITKYPSVFLLERPKVTKGSGTIEIEEHEEITEGKPVGTQNQSNGSEKTSILKTSCLENIVDCYLHGDNEQLSRQTLTIGGKSKNYKSFFKNIKYYKDEEGLIYWGEVKEIKKYGQNFRIIFKDKPWVNGNSYTVSIYVENDLIEKYRKRKMFRSQMDSLVDIDDEVLCFFTGAYSEITEIQKNDKKFKVLDVKIKNLDHVVITFPINT